MERSKEYFTEILSIEIHKSKQQSAFFQTAGPFVEEWNWRASRGSQNTEEQQKHQVWVISPLNYQEQERKKEVKHFIGIFGWF